MGASERPWRLLLRDVFGKGPPATVSGSVTVERRRVLILPTGQGYGFAATVVAVLIGAINYGNSLGYLVAFLLAGVGLVSALHAQRNLLDLNLRAGRVDPVFAGGEAVFRVCLENPAAARRPALALAYRCPDASSRGVRWREVPVSLPAGEGRCVDLALPAPRRGRLALGRLRVLTRFPLGLFRAWSPFELNAACLVYPRPVGASPLPAPAEPEPSPSPGPVGPSEQDFVGLREYVRGDSPRRIHWKLAAGGRSLPVKVFAGGRGDEVVLRWDEAGPGDTETRLCQLAGWIVEAERQGLRYGLEVPGQRWPPDRGSEHAHRCLTALALFGAPGG